MNNLRKILESDRPDEVLRNLDRMGLLRALEPSLAALRMDMPRGVHHKDNLIHSIQVLDNALREERNGADIILRTAALFHDIGKPATRKFIGSKTVSFDGHEVVGGRMVFSILARHDYTSDEIKKISELVKLHMRSHGFEENGSWSDSAVRRLINDVGDDEQMRRLFVIFRADVTTRHDNVRNRIHHQVDILEREMERIRREDARKALRPALNGNDVMSILHLTPGRRLGEVMRFLNSDEGVFLSRDEAERRILELFGKVGE